MPAPTPELLGHLERHAEFASRYVPSRPVDVWLPPGYVAGGDQRYPVLYVHDGQNLFNPKIAFGGVDWGLDEALVRLAGAGDIPETMVVAIWNTGERRWLEYMPQKPLASPTARSARGRFIREAGGMPWSDAYLRFLVEEVKPFVDARYRTLPGRQTTAVMGSSMGGLVSLYALCEYPAVFGGAGCLSTHWPAGGKAALDYVRAALPTPGAHRIYFDHGTETLDAGYAPYQRRVDQLMRARGYAEGVDWVTRTFEGAEHTEAAWRARVHIPLHFLLGGCSG